MSVQRDPDAVLAAWLDEGPRDLPDATRRAILTALPTTPQARRGPFAAWRTSRMNLLFRLAMAAVVAAVALGGALYLLVPTSQVGNESPGPTTPPTPPPSAPTGAPGVLAPTSRIDATHDGGLVFAFGSLWIGDRGGVQRVDPATNTVTVTIPISATIRRLWADSRSVFVSTDDGSFTIAPTTNVATSSGPAGMAAAESIWSIDANGTLRRFDPATGRQTGSVAVQGTVDWEPQLTFAFGSIWIAEGDTHELVRVDPAGPSIVSHVTGFSTDNSLFAIGDGFGSIWVDANAAGGSGILYRVDPAANRIVATIAVGDPTQSGGYGGTVIAFSQDSVWTADSSATITRVAAATNRVVATRALPLAEEWIAFGANSLWVRNQQVVAVQRYDAAAWASP